MPVAPQVRGGDRHDHHVAEAGGNVAVAARAGIGLARLVGLDEPHLHLAEDLGVVHGSAQERPEQEQDAHDHADGDVGEVGGTPTVGALGVEAHGASIAAQSGELSRDRASPPPRWKSVPSLAYCRGIRTR